MNFIDKSSGEYTEGTIEDLRCKLNTDLNKLNTDTLKDRCKEYGIYGIYKLKKTELIQMLLTKFNKINTDIHLKSKQDIKIISKSCDVKKISNSKKEYLIYHILLYHVHKMGKIHDNTIPSGINSRDFFGSKKSEDTLDKKYTANDNTITSSVLNIRDFFVSKKYQEARKRAEEEEARKRAEEEEARKRAEEEEARKRAEEEEARKRAEEEEARKRAEEARKRAEAKKKKQSIPKQVRMIVWNNYIGEDIIKHKCLCCKKVTISNTNFEVGHVLSEKHGGTLEITNLRPICGACNLSMGAENMIDFVVKFGLYIG